MEKYVKNRIKLLPHTISLLLGISFLGHINHAQANYIQVSSIYKSKKSELDKHKKIAQAFVALINSTIQHHAHDQHRNAVVAQQLADNAQKARQFAKISHAHSILRQITNQLKQVQANARGGKLVGIWSETLVLLKQLETLADATKTQPSRGPARKRSEQRNFQQLRRQRQEQADAALAQRMARDTQRKYDQACADARMAQALYETQQTEAYPTAQPQHRNSITQSLGAQTTEQFSGHLPSFRILAPQQTRGVSCGLHAIANLHTMQLLLPPDKELGRSQQQNFVNASQTTYDSLEKDYGCPQNQLELIELLQYIYNSKYAIRNLYAFRYNNSSQQLVPAMATTGNEQYYDALLPTFENSVRKLLRNDNELNIMNILLQTGQDQNSGHWTAVSIIKTASMPQPTFIFMDSIGNHTTTSTNPAYKQAIQAIQEKIIPQ